MSGWTWSPSTWKWNEWLMLGLAYAAQSEGRNFQGDFVHGLAVGLYISTFIVMLHGRHMLGMLMCALGVFTASGMTYSPRHGAIAIANHFMVAFILIGPQVGKWVATRKPKSAAQPVAT